MALQHLRLHQGPTVSYLHPTSLIIWLWNMGPNTSLIRQGWCFWQHLPASCSPYTIRGSCSQRHGSTSSWLTAAAVSADSEKSASTLQSRGKDGRVTWHLQSTLPVEWKRPPGRPRHTWLRTLGADLQPHNHGLNSAWRCAQDREHWKHLVKTATLQLGACAWWWYVINNNGSFNNPPCYPPDSH